MKNLPKPNQLKVFLAIIEHGSFNTAAKALHQTQPALTLAINELEKMLGTSLMTRGIGGIMLTEAGKRLENRARLILKELEYAVNETRQLSTSSNGVIKIGSASLPFFTVLPLAIDRFQKKFPHIQIHLEEGQLAEMLPALRDGRLDFAIGTTSLKNTLTKDFVVEPFFNTPCGVLVHKEHPFAQSTSLNHLRNGKWYLPAPKVGYYHQLEKILFPQEQQSAEQTVVRGNSAIMAVQLVMSSDFMTVVPTEILKIPYLNKHLCVIPIEEPLPNAQYSFIYSRQLPLTQIAKRMIKKLQRESDHYPWRDKIEA